MIVFNLSYSFLQDEVQDTLTLHPFFGHTSKFHRFQDEVVNASFRLASPTANDPAPATGSRDDLIAMSAFDETGEQVGQKSRHFQASGMERCGMITLVNGTTRFLHNDPASCCFIPR
jgi:hypothetical protein